MKIYLILFLFIGGCHTFNIDEVVGPSISPQCRKLNTKFAQSISEFYQCIVVHGRPITLCQRCGLLYQDVKKKYKALSNTMQPKYKNKKSCLVDLIGQDTLQIVHIYYTNVISFWKMAKCTECYPHFNSTGSSNEKQFRKHATSLYTCYMKNRNESLLPTEKCKNCLKEYLTLNSHYRKMVNFEDALGGCADIMSLMNTTFKSWNEFCPREKDSNQLTFLALIFILFLSTITFYVFVRTYKTVDKGVNTRIPRVE